MDGQQCPSYDSARDQLGFGSSGFSAGFSAAGARDTVLIVAALWLGHVQQITLYATQIVNTTGTTKARAVRMKIRHHENTRNAQYKPRSSCSPTPSSLGRIG